jgi:hypothetical protein
MKDILSHKNPKYSFGISLSYGQIQLLERRKTMIPGSGGIKI